jgi:hypothetical protein
MSDAGEPTKPSVVELCKTALTEHFKQHPSHEPSVLATFRAEAGLLAPHLRSDTAIPQNPETPSMPSLLLHDLENKRNKEKPVYMHIAAAGSDTPYALYGTSGAGKSCSIFEFLSHNHGLFFVASDHKRNAGSILNTHPGFGPWRNYAPQLSLATVIHTLSCPFSSSKPM